MDLIIMDLRWQEPGPTGVGRPSKHGELAAALRSNPGQWAVVSDVIPSVTSTTISRGDSPAYRPPGSFEATSRRNTETNKYEVFARYVGDENVSAGNDA